MPRSFMGSLVSLDSIATSLSFITRFIHTEHLRMAKSGTALWKGVTNMRTAGVGECESAQPRWR